MSLLEISLDTREVVRKMDQRSTVVESTWRLVPVGEMIDLMQYGSSAKTSEEPGGVPVLRMGNIQEGKLNLGSLKYLPADHDEFPTLLLQDGDVLFNRTNSSELVGKTAVYRGQARPCSFASYLIRLRLKPGYSPEYLSYYLNSPYGRAWIATVVSQQVGQANVNGSKLKALSVPVPDLTEQLRIVEEIETQLSRLEAGVSALKRAQANLKRYRAAILKAACEGRLVPTEAELDRTDRSPSETFKESGELPEGWLRMRLDEVSDALCGFAFQSSKFSDSGYQVVKMANIKMGQLDLSQRPSFIQDVPPAIIKKFELHHGDLLITLTGTREKRDYGYVVVVRQPKRLLINQRIARLRPKRDVISGFLYLILQSEQYRDRFFAHETGNVGQGNVGMRAVTLEPVPVPPLTEQERIVAEVERRLSVVDELEATITANLHRATRLRQSIFGTAFNIRPPRLEE